MKNLSLFALLVAISATAHATGITSGTGALVGFHACIAGTSGCDNIDSTPGPGLAHFYAGLPGDSSSNTGLAVLGGYGSGSASATLGSLAVDGAPVLNAYATSATGERVLGTAVALQSYTWDGTGPATRTYGGTLTYSQTVTGSYPSLIGNGVNADIDVFTLSGATYDAGTTTEDNLGYLISPPAQPGYTEVGSGAAGFTDSSSNPDGSATVTDTVTLTPGVTYWVWALL